MSSEWAEYSVDELKSDKKMSIAIGPFGSRMKSDCYISSGIPVIRCNNLSGSISFTGEFVYISQEKADELYSSNVFENDLVFPHRGNIGEVGIVLGDQKRYVLSSSLMKLTVDRSLVDPLFLFYFFRSDIGKYELLKNASQVGTPGIATPLTSLRNIRLKIPSLNDQQIIINILKTLDNKIELNRKMNATLEAMAQAFFKSWFIDFDPVKAKAEGRQLEGMDAETAALFPDEFEESELGRIPKGWKIVMLGDLIEVKHGYAFQGEFFTNEPNEDILLTPGNFEIGGGFKADKFKYYCGEFPEDYVLNQGDLIVTMTDLSKASDTLGYPAIVPKISNNRFLHNQRLGRIIIKANTQISKMYIYYLLRTEAYRNEILASATGTTVRHTSPNRIKAFKFPFPTNGVSLEFEKYAIKFYEKFNKNDEQARILTDIRDLLIPKLISGQIQIGNF